MEFVTSWLAIFLMASRMAESSVVTIGLVVKSETCLCNTTVQTHSCAIQEITKNHHRFNRSHLYPTKSLNLDVATIPRLDTRTVDLRVVWQAPEGIALSATNGFVLELVAGVKGMQILYIPMAVTSTRTTHSLVVLTVQCELESASYGDSLLVRMCPTPLPLPVNIPGKYQSRIIDIPTYEGIAEVSVLLWRPSIIFNMDEKEPRFDISFTIPKRFSEELLAFCIQFKPQLNRSCIYKPIKNGHFVFQSQQVQDLNTCYDITLKKIIDSGTRCENWEYATQTGGCAQIPILQARKKLWNGSDCPVPAVSTAPPPLVRTITFIPAVLATSVEGAVETNTFHNKQTEGQSAIIVAPLVIIPLVIGLIIVIFIAKNRWKQAPDKPRTDEQKRRRSSEKEPSDFPGRINNEEFELVGFKKVLLLYSDDHLAHKEVIQEFATFLQARCKCKVIFDEWNVQEMSRDILGWYLQQLEKVDKVIFVHSEGTFRKYKAYIMGEELVDADWPAKGDPFFTLLPIVLKRMQDKKMCFIMIHFPYMKTEFLIKDIRNNFIYNLPKHFQDFVLHIHDERKYEFRAKNRIEVINNEDYHTNKEGKALQCAIENAITFTNNNPNWWKTKMMTRNRCSESGKKTGKAFDLSSDCSNSCSNLQSFTGKKFNGLRLIPPNSGLNSEVTSIADFPELQEPQGSIEAASDVSEDNGEAVLRLDSGLGQEVLHGILPQAGYNVNSLPEAYGKVMHPSNITPIPSFLNQWPLPSVGSRRIASRHANSMDDSESSMGDYGNLTDDYENSVDSHGALPDEYGNQLFRDRSIFGCCENSTNATSECDHENSEGDRGNSAGDQGNSVGENGHLWSDRTNLVWNNENQFGDHGNILIGDHSNGDSYQDTLGCFGGMPDDCANAPNNFGNGPIGNFQADGSLHSQDSADLPGDSYGSIELQPPESISSCTSSIMDLEINLDNQADHFSISTGIPDTNTDGFECSSV